MLYMYLSVACGGALGACLRFYLSQLSIKHLGIGFPFGILIINVIGSFALGLVYAYFEQKEGISIYLKVFTGVGLLGALTTFSTFSYETVVLLQQTEYLKALLNILLNVGLCLFGVWLAFAIIKG